MVDLLKDVFREFGNWAILLGILFILAFAMIRKVKVYETFVEGAKEGFTIAVRIIPYLVAILVAIGIFRASGAMDVLFSALSPVLQFFGFPAEALPMALVRPLSGSGALGVLGDILLEHGPDSFVGRLASTMMGSTETTFYVLAVYLGSVGIRKGRHTLAACLIADAAGIISAFFICKLVFG